MWYHFQLQCHFWLILINYSSKNLKNSWKKKIEIGRVIFNYNYNWTWIEKCSWNIGVFFLMITKIIKNMTYDVAMLFNSCMMFDGITSVINILIINQLGSLLMPKIFWSWPSNQKSFSIVHKIDRWISLLSNHHYFIQIYRFCSCDIVEFFLVKKKHLILVSVSSQFVSFLITFRKVIMLALFTPYHLGCVVEL